ncbi:MAG TPA: L-histidine N(alpha)-methyltransferase [bacterium]|nr:L-histidine N(alpha)-methyltransferase [bacterium]
MQSEPQRQRSARRGSRPPAPKLVQTSLPSIDDVAATIWRGLTADSATIPARFLYDELGSRLFDAITALPEYYPTRTEAAIFAEHLPALARLAPVQGCTLIDLGAGSCEKAPRLFPFVHPRQYVAVDISVDHLRTALERLQIEHPDIEMLGVGTDFSTRLELPAAVRRERRLFFYPGSSIGNFEPHAAVTFLAGLRAAMEPDGALWIGVDLQKSVDVLVRAYDDELGVTAAFNRNALRHVNALLGTDFAPGDWRHVARYDRRHQRIEMHLEAGHEVTARCPLGERTFQRGERIHTESSYKHTPEGFRDLLARAGLRVVGHHTDDEQWFGIFVAVPAASS